MAFKVSYDLGAEKDDIAYASASAGTAGLEILVDNSKIKTAGDLEKALRRALERVSELPYPPA
ncbi:MAG: hypothetical protein E6Q97_07535 [Desulfurellales bacterium]|nr:MAG: hypothetical protein E6Q97_07535 [Desulfurellales bacterium]